MRPYTIPKQSENPEMQIEERSLDSITPYDKNPRVND